MSDMSFQERLEKIETLLCDDIKTMLTILVDRQRVKEYYTVEEFAGIVGRSEFTCREWCRNGRVNAQKRQSGRGPYAAWVISHAEFLRYQKEGLIPCDPFNS